MGMCESRDVQSCCATSDEVADERVRTTVKVKGMQAVKRKSSRVGSQRAFSETDDVMRSYLNLKNELLQKAMAEKEEANARKEKAKRMEKLEKAKRQLAELKKSIRQDPHSEAKLQEMKAIRERIWNLDTVKGGQQSRRKSTV
ncbi:hypothetical protein GUITHDRAFT_103075 [Guillardia theta CCMP2712]|uniref:Uncharacterized protein n=1 Tax=Guillardia theta (strain CCMP2712) TaxID=905079 RepID=L1JSJ0_GUITC|nr:hypothetical protein GUITHDRAFT_103075 [Guillardia theta CCMP2712]EKX51155.1 hypothetical protein GUITHDRAFT_103075 [Guillardia theta CCMP2712]|eukprot:XP_005838135.1 hypothetical protein GUITHDRAFT_103075 [Guillardia theta CCMP2712]